MLTGANLIAGRESREGKTTFRAVDSASGHPLEPAFAAATSVGTAAILRFARPVSFQDVPDALLPEELRDRNPRGIWRLVDGQPTKDPS